MALLSVKHLSKHFKVHTLGGKTIQGFEDVSFEVEEGGALALTGPSGSGKSSVLKCIYRTYMPTAGSLCYHSKLYGEVDLAGLSEHEVLQLRAREIGYATQFLKVIPRVPAVNIVAEPLLDRTSDLEKARCEARRLLERLHIPEKLMDAYPVTFSGGEQQRVNIARALIRKPRLLLLDEPTASLDRRATQIVVELLNELRQAGTSLVMIFHDPAIMNEVADAVFQMPKKQPAVTDDVQILPAARSHRICIENSRAVTPTGIIERATILIEGRNIRRIISAQNPLKPVAADTRVNAEGLWVMPGFIDLHSDAIEKEIQPRPGGKFPMDMALVELDKKLASCGITSMYHCLCFSKSEKNELRQARVARYMVHQINGLKPHLSVRHNVHARFEMLDTECIPIIEALIENRDIQLFSIMDHTPGQGQFAAVEDFKKFYRFTDHLDDGELDRLLRQRVNARKSFDDAEIRRLIRLCRHHGIPTASHDDDTEDMVRWVHDMGVDMCEFPVTLEAARTAVTLDMKVLMGAPNILRGKSLTNNLSGRIAVHQGCCHVIGSDYSPTSMIHALFALDRLQANAFHELVKMVSFHPSQVLGMENRFGSIAEGRLADLVLVDDSGPVPRIVKTFVEGRQVFSAI